MAAYNTQSKIQLFDDDSANSEGARNNLAGVSAKNIPLAALRPNADAGQIFSNQNISRPSKNNLRQEIVAYKDIGEAYKKMKGIEEEDDSSERGDREGEYEDDDEKIEIPKGMRARDLSGVKRFEASYVEDMPDSDEGLLEVLELAIRNARANLEMLESLYAALSPQT